MLDPVSKEKVFESIALSKQEKVVAGFVVDGYSNKEVSSRLNIAEKTVKFHLTNIYQKAGFRGRRFFSFVMARAKDLKLVTEGYQHKAVLPDSESKRLVVGHDREVKKEI